MVDSSEFSLLSAKPVAIGALSKEEIDIELMKGLDSMKDGKFYTIDEVDAELNSYILETKKEAARIADHHKP